MVNIIVTIDNAVQRDETYCLIFTDNEIYQFLTMDRKEKLSDVWHADMNNPERMAPVVGYVSNVKVMQEDNKNISIENAKRAKEIEDNLEEKINEIPPKYTVIPYSNVDKAEFNGGTVVSIPHIILHVNGKKLKFHLVEYNFKGGSKLPDKDKTFSEYESAMKTAFGSKLEVKN